MARLTTVVNIAADEYWDVARLTTVVNIAADEYWDVAVCRGTPWGNPFKIGKDGTREECIAKFREWVRTQPELMRRAKALLRGRILGCYCKPDACHGDVWAEIADAEPL